MFKIVDFMDISNINNMAKYRNTLFEKLLAESENSSSQSPKTKKDSILLDNITDEVDKMKQLLALNENKQHENIKMAKINNYYSDRSKAYISFFKFLFYCSIPLLLLAVLINRNILPSRYGNILIGIVLICTIFWGGSIYYDIISRDNMNFNEYDFDNDFDTNGGTPPRGFEGSFWPTGCTNEDCCAEGTIYDDTNGICVAPSTKN